MHPRALQVAHAAHASGWAVLLSGVLVGAVACTPAVRVPTLVGYARLSAVTLAAGPPSGAYLGTRLRNGQSLPLPAQPVQGVSSLVAGDAPDRYFGLADNGYGAIENSADFHLRIYRLRLHLRTGQGDARGDGRVEVEGYIELRDPQHKVPFALRNGLTTERILTGADFDVESLVRAPDGTFWLGDEFGPSLLHCDAEGTLLDPPYALSPPGQPELRSPQSPLSEESSALRVMNALAGHALAHAPLGQARAPVFSPHHLLLADGDPQTFVETRARPPAGSGLWPASSEIIDVALLRRAGHAVIPWTVNETARMTALLTMGVDGMISDRPDRLAEVLRRYDGDHDGQPDFVLPSGLFDRRRFDAQGHRGARDLRPENTLPAMEAALDALMTTLETDTGLTQDGVLVLSHDAHVQAQTCRRSDGKPYGVADERLIKDSSLAGLQRDFICDRLFRGPQQSNELSLSPVAVAFAREVGLPHAYAMPALQQLFDFVAAYVRYYRSGPGATHPEAARRAENASQVRFNIETKLNPRRDLAGRTVGPEVFADTLAGLIERNHLSERALIQSFDYRTLLRVQSQHPGIRTAALLGDFPRFGSPAGTPLPGSDDGTNLQGEDGGNTPWLGGLFWPYRVTAGSAPPRVRTSGGIEAMSLSADAQRLIVFLEKPLADETGFIRGFEFDLASRRFLPATHRYPLSPGSTSVGEMATLSERAFLFIERDDSEGRLDATKHIYLGQRGDPGQPFSKRLIVDLLQLADPLRLAGAGQPGDLGLGPRFAFPYFTIESVLPRGPRHLLVANDNNLPFSVGRHRGTGAPDDSEFILIELPTPLP